VAVPKAVTRTSEYEAEPAQRRVLGSVAGADAGTWWSGAITVPEDGSALAWVQLTRHGSLSRSVDGVGAIVPVGELPAVALLFTRLAAAVGQVTSER
jgi:hypothetical protein